MALFDNQGKAATNFMGLLETLHLGKLLNSEGDYWRQKKERKLIVLKDDDTLEHALTMLTTNKILSAPITTSDSETFVGFLSLNDVVNFILKTYSNTTNKESEEVEWSSWCDDFYSLSFRGVSFAQTPVKDIVKNLSEPICQVNEFGTVYQLMEDVFQSGYHRAIVLKDIPSSFETKALGIVTQSDIIHLLWENIYLCGDIIHQEIGDLRIFNPTVISMSENALAIHAFYLMMFNKVEGVAIVDKEEKMIANLSAADLRMFRKGTFASLVLPIMKFLELMDEGGIREPITVTPLCSLESAIMKIVQYHLHRIWVVNERNQPIGVLTLTDLLSHFIKLDKNAFPVLPLDTQLSTNVRGRMNPFR
eukprot:TRINITY_DN561_c0_g1_i1.p1 TRINITY_DN561_c0_g1~~TRINITY_DN561_c0_g1_i1.p1  ORF type:complete len:363 (+),score=58.01 TRINITY_DN561_c0_g1_i1:210-1298(+)